MDAQQPFSDREAVVVVSTKRPPAALVPTFAAPSVSDGAGAEQTDPGTDDDGQLDSSTDSPDEDELTLFS